MKKNVWIFNHYAMPPKYEMRVRNNKMAHFMQKKGYTVTIFSASTIHNTEINLIEGNDKYIKRRYDDLNFVHIKAPLYKGNGLSRIKNMMLFPIRLFLYTKNFEEKPDIIISDLGLRGLFFPFMIARRYKCPIITEIRDLWPESIIEFGLLSRRNPIASILYWCEKQVYKASDAVVFAKEGEVYYIREQGWDKESGGPIEMSKIHYINNGVDISEFYKNIDTYRLEDPELNDSTIFKVVYTGSIRHANNVGILLDVAKSIDEWGYNNIKFLIYGDGDQRKEMEERIEKENIPNVSIKGHVEKKYVPFILNHSSLNVLHYMQSGTWKRGNSSNKLFEYMASGKPILSTIHMNYCIIDRYKCGETVDEYTPEAIAQKIVQFYEMSQDEYNKYCQNALHGAKEFDWKVLTDKLIDVIETL